MELEQTIEAAQQAAIRELEGVQANLLAAESNVEHFKALRLKTIEQARQVLTDQGIAELLGISTRSLGALFRSSRAAGAPEDVDVVDGRTGEVIWDKVTTVKQNVTTTNAQAEGVGSEA